MQNLHKPERNISLSLKKETTTVEVDYFFFFFFRDVLTEMSTAHFRLHLNVLVVAIGVGMC